jgi:hypothetical protein
MPGINALCTYLDSIASVPHMKIRRPTPTGAGKAPSRAARPAWRKYKGTLAWFAVTAGICVAILIAFQGFSVDIGIALAVVTAIAALLLKLAMPRLKARSDDKRIATIKARHETSRIPSPTAGSGPIDAFVSHPVDASQLKATDGFALMHMGPPEVIDLDLSRKRDGRGRITIDSTMLIERLNQAISNAIELEDNGAVDRAILQYEKALELARQLGRDDEALSYENRINQLKQEKGSH